MPINFKANILICFISSWRGVIDIYEKGHYTFLNTSCFYLRLIFEI